ncbi:MAG: dehydrogenase E1 component subunit alpha/beta [Ignavibacteriae bacterium]|nr:dehydrogenase E1 component subunit alpha/beta [Ignavibacteriota bacterium]MCB9244752.1 dehydrogenase [Ignavibacteriales bacterium]
MKPEKQTGLDIADAQDFDVSIKYDRKVITDEELITLYLTILKPRMIEEKMLLLLRKGRISKWFSGIGQEAIAVGVTNALEDDEYILPMHRNLGVFTTRNMPLDKLFMQLQGKHGGFSKGRERSFHFGSNEHHIVGMISHLGPQLTIADGIALACKLKKESKVTAVFTGEGGTSEGDFHEALNVASVWDLPVIFIIENNGYGLSTTIKEQYRCESLIDRAAGYGMEGFQIDGNDIVRVYKTVSTLAESIRANPRPVLLECMTFRMRGHEEASGTKYVPQELFTMWEKKDPVRNYETYLLKEGIITTEFVEETRTQFAEEINDAIEKALSAENPKPDTETEESSVYMSYDQEVVSPESDKTREMRFVDAVSDGLRIALRRYDNLVVLGQDIAEYGGVFKVTEGFYEEFGKERIRNTPICESAIIGTSLGLSIKKMKSVVEMQFADFVTSGFNQVVNNLAKIFYRWEQNADVVIRMPTGAGVGAGPFHSQSNEAWFFHTPGLKVVYPSTPYDAKGLLLAAIEDPNPVMFFEHKFLYRKLKDQVPEDYYTVEIGKARIVREGNDITIITYGQGVYWAMDILNENQDIDAEVIDLRTLLPLDKETIFSSVKKTGKVLILHEDCITGGIGSEIAALISEKCFEYLDAPVFRAGGLDTPVPFAAELEQNFFPLDRARKLLRELYDY